MKNLRKYFVMTGMLTLTLLLSSCNKETDEKPDGFGEVTDVEGHVYQTVTINGLTWMTGNLRVTSYRNGEPVNPVTDGNAWAYTQEGACCYYENDENNAAKYGCLYNWQAVNDPRGLAPEGWHVATFTEWENLREAAGGSQAAGGVLKSAGTTLWLAPNTGATNNLQFSALPAGLRDCTASGPFYEAGRGAYFWTATSYDALNASCWYVTFESSELYESLNGKGCGLSVRCVKD